MAGVVSSFSQLTVVFVHLDCWCTLFVLDYDKSASCCCKGWFVGIRFYMSEIKHMLVQLLGLLIIILIGRMGKEAGCLSDREV